ncbi:MAG TPA: hypothetical protein PK402_04210, partial [Tepidisphaeraceae bacterium]|nr:hypothetical protein [Tepidisphaeraceae bacterium]
MIKFKETDLGFGYISIKVSDNVNHARLRWLAYAQGFKELSMQVRKARRIVLAAAVAVVGLSFGEVASAQLNYGDALTVHGWHRDTYSGRLYIVRANGNVSQLGSDWGWNESPMATILENNNSALVFAGTHYSTYTPQLYRVNLTTGARTHLTSLADWPRQINDATRDPNTGQIYLATGKTQYHTGYEGYIYKFNPNTYGLQQLGGSFSWTQNPRSIAVDNSGYVWTANSWYGDSYNGQLYRTDPNTGQHDQMN